MKRLILIIPILLVASSLKSQTFRNDSTIFNMPAKFGQITTLTLPDTLKTEKPSLISKTYTKALQIPHIKLKAISLAVIGIWGYVFREDLRKWSIEHDKEAHVLLSIGLTKFFGWKFAAGFMLSIEATQADIFGTEGRYEDTAEDIFMDSWGIAFALQF
jgi:hypothetical protein